MPSPSESASRAKPLLPPKLLSGSRVADVAARAGGTGAGAGVVAGAARRGAGAEVGRRDRAGAGAGAGGGHEAGAGEGGDAREAGSVGAAAGAGGAGARSGGGLDGGAVHRQRAFVVGHERGGPVGPADERGGEGADAEDAGDEAGGDRAREAQIAQGELAEVLDWRAGSGVVVHVKVPLQGLTRQFRARGLGALARMSVFGRRYDWPGFRRIWNPARNLFPEQEGFLATGRFRGDLFAAGRFQGNPTAAA